MISRRKALLSALAALPACRRDTALARGFPGYAFVANSGGQAVAAVDLSAFAVVRHIRLDANPTAVATHPARPFVYALTPSSATIHEINAEKLVVARKLRLPASPNSLRLSHDGSALWLMCPEARQLLRVATGKLQVDLRLALPAAPFDMDFSATGDLLAVSLGESGQAALVQQGKVQQLIEFGGILGAIRFRADGRHLLAANRSANQLLIHDIASRKMVVRLPLAVRPDLIAAKHDGGQIFIASESSGSLVAVYPYLTQVGYTMLAGHAPRYLAASSRPNYLLAANPQSNDVTILNIDNQKVVGVSPAGREPSFIAITPDNQYALVLNKQSGDMAVLHIPTLDPKLTNRFKSSALFTMVPVGSAPIAAVIRRA